MTLVRLLNWVRSPLKSALNFGTRSGWLSLLVWLAAISPAHAALELRIAIEDGVNQVTVGSSTKAAVLDGSGRPLGEIAAMNAFVAKPTSGGVALDQWKSGQIWVQPSGDGYVYIGNRWYRGKTLVVPTSKGLTAVNYVDLEHYLASVLGGEMSGGWPQEALKAQAVAARSYALYQRQRGANSVYDLGDTAAWQVYDGVEDESVGTQMAVKATAGQVLTYNG
ncbi:SpoIID/LytB domain-containing protein, partial [Leptolyngbya sp. FACHB-36]|uniref:SpoIID/LytB domain-containing protein n=1 Tax=Leptolyngbya sp. FACHB-36 TaxID=2692808 RepID=UPI0016817D83